MVGHTGFLITARRLADGVTAPPRRRRPSKGAEAELAEAELAKLVPPADVQDQVKQTSTGP
jgi:tRNA (adenine57-N1/adenine58-N1)-methyltransferase